MSLLILNGLFLFCINVYPNSDFGPGLVSVNFDGQSYLEFYSDTLKNKPYKTIEFFDDKQINSWNIRNLKQHEEWLEPEILWLDYNALSFRCLEQTENWFKVIVNNNSGKTLWLKKTKETEFKTWEEFLRMMFVIKRSKSYTQKIRREADDNAEEIKFSGPDCFEVISMKGDWIEIKTASHCEENQPKSNLTKTKAWIKWREGSKLTIEYFWSS